MLLMKIYNIIVCVLIYKQHIDKKNLLKTVTAAILKTIDFLPYFVVWGHCAPNLVADVANKQKANDILFRSYYDNIHTVSNLLVTLA